MSYWRDRLLCDIERLHRWFRTEPDEVVNGVTMVLMVASVGLLGSLIV
jgi:hypothetical protein